MVLQQSSMTISKTIWSILQSTVLFIAILNVATGGEVPASDLELEDTSNFPEIYYSIKRGEIEPVREFIKEGGDINSREGLGVTPIILASAYGHKDIVQLLVESGADPNISTINGNTALIHAGLAKSWEIVEYLVYHGADVNSTPDRDTLNDPILCIASWAAPEKIVKLLLDNGAKINYETQYTKRTPLAIAVMSGRADNVRLLLKNGADIKSVTVRSPYDGRSAVWYARKNGYTEVLKLISTATIYKPHLEDRQYSANELILILYNDRTIKLSEEESVKKQLDHLTERQLKLIRNAIFARYNYKFTTPWLIEYYTETFPEYKPSVGKPKLTKDDKSNIQYLLRIEKMKKK